MKGYHPVDCESLGRAVSEVGQCVRCQSPLVLDDFSQRSSLVSTLKICCTNSSSVTSKARSPTHKAKSLNARPVLAMREIGRGCNYMRPSLGSWTRSLLLPPRSYKIHNQALAEASMFAAIDNMTAALEYLHWTDQGGV